LSRLARAEARIETVNEDAASRPPKIAIIVGSVKEHRVVACGRAIGRRLSLSWPRRPGRLARPEPGSAAARARCPALGRRSARPPGDHLVPSPLACRALARDPSLPSSNAQRFVNVGH
jgi:hypothetical protein